MATLELTQVYLEPLQKRALQRRAKARGTKVSEEIRMAIDAYLGGMTVDELERLDAATRTAAKDFEAIIVDLERINERVDETLTRIDQLRFESPIARYAVAARAS